MSPEGQAFLCLVTIFGCPVDMWPRQFDFCRRLGFGRNVHSIMCVFTLCCQTWMDIECNESVHWENEKCATRFTIDINEQLRTGHDGELGHLGCSETLVL